MLRKLLILGLAAGASTSVPMLYEANPQAFARLVRLAMERPAAAEAEARPPAEETSVQQPPGRKVLVQADARGHFVAAFRVNGRPVEAMVDTGATVVALNLTTARKAGIALRPSDFTQSVDTANGRARAAAIEIGSLQIGRIVLDRVRAVVLEDRALQTNLVGMSFLGRLGRYQVENGTLLLAQ